MGIIIYHMNIFIISNKEAKGIKDGKMQFLW